MYYRIWYKAELILTQLWINHLVLKALDKSASCFKIFLSMFLLTSLFSPGFGTEGHLPFALHHFFSFNGPLFFCYFLSFLIKFFIISHAPFYYLPLSHILHHFLPPHAHLYILFLSTIYDLVHTGLIILPFQTSDCELPVWNIINI